MKKKLTILVVIITVTAAGLLWLKTNQPLTPSSSTTTPPTQTDKPQIISTKPDPLENAIIGANEIIEISFNRPLENVGEFKSRLEPKIDYKVELSPDRKTARIIPNKPYELGASFTIFIGPDTKFDGVGAWGQEKIYHFKTIKYTGV